VLDKFKMCVIAIPAYQADAVAAYKASSDANLPPQKKLQWNNTGRGYPDIAALGGTKTPYCIATGGRFTGVAGTVVQVTQINALLYRGNHIYKQRYQQRVLRKTEC